MSKFSDHLQAVAKDSIQLDTLAELLTLAALRIEELEKENEGLMKPAPNYTNGWLTKYGNMPNPDYTLQCTTTSNNT